MGNLHHFTYGFPKSGVRSCSPTRAAGAVQVDAAELSRTTYYVRLEFCRVLETVLQVFRITHKAQDLVKDQEYVMIASGALFDTDKVVRVV